jgi:hypothetical protein
MAKKSNKKAPAARSGVAVAMIKRFPRTQIMRDRRERRPKDAKHSWRKEEY